MTWGPQLEFLEEVERNTGIRPGALAERPVLTPVQNYYKNIYDDLGGSRGYTADGQPLPVPLSEVLAYCEMFHIHGLDRRDRLLKMIRAMDSGFLKVMREKAERSRKAAAKR